MSFGPCAKFFLIFLIVWWRYFRNSAFFADRENSFFALFWRVNLTENTMYMFNHWLEAWQDLRSQAVLFALPNPIWIHPEVRRFSSSRSSSANPCRELSSLLEFKRLTDRHVLHFFAFSKFHFCFNYFPICYSNVRKPLKNSKRRRTRACCRWFLTMRLATWSGFTPWNLLARLQSAESRVFPEFFLSLKSL